MAILSFDGCVNIAIRIVTGKYPEAKLYEADGTSSTGSTTDPDKIDTLRVVFQNTNNSTVIIQSKEWGEFREPELIDQPWLEDVVIEWPVKMDLPEANELKEKAGFKAPFTTVTLRNPLGPTIGNPYFIFGGNPAQPYVFVDTLTGDVHSTSVKQSKRKLEAVPF